MLVWWLYANVNGNSDELRKVGFVITEHEARHFVGHVVDATRVVDIRREPVDIQEIGVCSHDEEDLVGIFTCISLNTCSVCTGDKRAAVKTCGQCHCFKPRGIQTPVCESESIIL